MERDSAKRDGAKTATNARGSLTTEDTEASRQCIVGGETWADERARDRGGREAGGGGGGDG